MPEASNNKPTTLREIAVVAGVAVSTVSYALNGRPGVSPKTRKKVLEAAEKLNWRPNPLVGALLSHVRKPRKEDLGVCLGFVVACKNKEVEDYFTSLTYKAYYEGAKARASELGFKLEIFPLDSNSISALNKTLLSRGIPGLIIAPLKEETELKGLAWDQFATVAIAYSLRNESIHRVAHNHFEGVFMAVKKLHSYGYERIGLAISKEIDKRSAFMISGGYWSGIHHFDLPKIAPLNQKSSIEQRTHLKEWLETEKPDVVISLSGTEKAIQKCGYRIPKDIAFVDIDLTQKTSKRVTGIDQNSETIGKNAIDLLSAQLFRNERGIPRQPKILLSEGQWIDGNTAPKLNFKT